MGEVWLARDTTLGRQVALKFLRAELQTDEIARQRLVREARAVAALNQPFICGIHAVGEEEGSTYLAMEYVEGQTLQQRLLTGPLPLREALRLGVEIAEALDKAHQKGIIHRDLKPSNVMITTEGHAKVMDFGLAKTVEGAGGLEEHIHSLSLTLTDQEMLVGTISYMSPEQIRAQDLDHRSDIFSFGLLLYEMLTGCHPFRADSPLDTAVAIIDRDCPPLPAELSETAPELQSFLNQLLAKNAAQRPDSLQQAKATLGHLLEETTATASLALPQGRRRRFTIAGILGMVAIVGLALILLVGRPPPAESVRMFVDEFLYQGNPSVDELNPSWSPRGDAIVFNIERGEETDIYVAPVAGGEPVCLTSDNEDRDFGATWSPDGNGFAFYSIREGSLGLYTMTARGQDVRRITDVAFDRPLNRWPTALSWRHPDRLVYPDRSEQGKWDIYMIDPGDPGIPENLTSELRRWFTACDLSRSGRYLLCGSTMARNNAPVFLVDLQTSVAESLSCSGMAPRWGPEDRTVWFLQWDGEKNYLNLFSAAVDTVRMQLSGKLERRTTGQMMGGYSISPDGKSIVVLDATGMANDLFIFPETEVITDIAQATWRTEVPVAFGAASFLPDGSGCLATQYADPDAEISQIVRIAFDDSAHPLRLGEGTTGSSLPLTSPQSEWAVASIQLEDGTGFFPHIARLDGGAWRLLDHSLPERYQYFRVLDWSADGTRLAFNAYAETDTFHTIGVIDIDPGSGQSVRIQDLHIRGWRPCLSPCGRFLVYSVRNRATGIDEIWRVESDGANAQIIIPESWFQPLIEKRSDIRSDVEIYGWSAETDMIYFEFLRDIWRFPVDADGQPETLPEIWLDLPDRFLFPAKHLDFRDGGVLIDLAWTSTDLVILSTEDRQ